jgi:hypothetical protein
VVDETVMVEVVDAPGETDAGALAATENADWITVTLADPAAVA